MQKHYSIFVFRPKAYSYTTTELRGHSLKLYKKSSRLELRKHVFSQRIVDHWNKLPDDVVSAATISSFKKRLDIWMERYGH